MASVGRTVGRRLAAAFTAALLVFSGSAAALAAHDGGHEGAAGLTCSALVPGSTALTMSIGAFNDTVSGSDGTISVTLVPAESDDGPIFDWSSTLPVDAIIVAGGPKVMAWEYEPAVTSGSGLHAPLNNEGAHYHKPKSVSVCYRLEVPEIDLAVTKVDSADPVRVGDQFDYVLTVSNTGGEAFSSVTLEDPLPTLVNAVSVEGCPDWDGSAVVNCDLGALPAETTLSVVITVEAIEAGVAVNQAVATAITSGEETVTASASEATVIEKKHEDGGDDHDHSALSCDAFGPGLSQVDVGEDAMHGGTMTVGDDFVSITVSVYEGDMGKLFDWSATYPLSGVLTLGGNETLAFPYSPPAFDGSGLHAPLAGGESHYRGLRQVAFCYLPGPYVDVGIEMTADEPRVLVGDTITYTISVTNLGVATAEDVTVVVDPDVSVELDLEAGSGTIGAVVRGETVSVVMTGEALAADAEATVVATVAAANEDEGVEGNNVAEATVEILETRTADTEPEPEEPDTSSTTTTSTTTPPDVLGTSTTTIAPATLDTLPFTGVPTQSLAAVAAISILSGLVLLRWARPRPKEVDLILYRQGEEHLIPW